MVEAFVGLNAPASVWSSPTFRLNTWVCVPNVPVLKVAV